jgi:hypothetical protein
MGVPMHILQPHATSAPMEQNAGSLAVAPSTQGALMHHCNSQGSPSEAADPSSHPVITYAACIRTCTSAVFQGKTMLTTFPKVQVRFYEHEILVLVPPFLAMGSQLSGSSFFLDDFNKVWKNQLIHHTDNGSSLKNNSSPEAAYAKQVRSAQAPSKQGK